MGRSFIDTDLLEQPGRDSAEPLQESDAALRLARQKEQIAGQVADAAEEIERLQLRQQELEQARHALRELHRKQNAYEEGKKALIEQLSRRSLQLQREEVRLTRLLELATVTRQDFEDMLRELHAVREDQWPESGFEESLDAALALLDSMRGSYTKSTARLDAQGLDHAGGERSGKEVADERTVVPLGGWWVWWRAGLAFSIPMAFFGCLLLLLYLYLQGLL
jgi:hypothetical protein